MNLENLFSSLLVGIVDRYLPVEASRTQQRRIQNVGTVGSSHHNDPAVSAKAVHFHQQLVQSLFPLIVSAA